ncbi:MAG: amidohydrolase family protein [Solirubrobacteraceae bacterium]
MATSEPGEEAVAILDCHCHAWRRWPYLPPVPDEDTRGAVELLLFEMEQHQVEQAMVVCAAIDHNADNVDYVSRARSRARGELKRRLHLVADLDCTWHDTYHTPGAPERLRALADRYELVGFTHYLGEHNDGWLRSEEADAVFAFAAERRLIVSLGAPPQWQSDLRPLAARHPGVPVLCHALGVFAAADGLDSPGLAEVLASAAVPNIMLKVSGLHYVSARAWDYPWPDAVAGLERLHDAYGANRLCWGSDFPACTRYTTFRQTLEVVRSHCPFLSPTDLALILGENLRGLLASGPAGG